jgi:phage portal protein BeeE
MQILGIEIKKAQKPEQKTAPYHYETQYNGQNGIILDGKAIARNHATYSRMFRINTDIRRCVKEISETSAKSGYDTKQILTDGSDKDISVPQFEQALKASGGFKHIKDEIIKNLSIFGNAYIRKHNNARGQGVKYTVLDSRYISITTDSELIPLRYQYNPPFKQGGVQTYQPEEIIHIKDTTDPDNPVFGMTIMETLVLDVMGDEEASLSNYHFFGNDSIPSALFVLKEGLTKDQAKDQFDLVKEALSGGHNKHKNIVSQAITDVKPIRQDHTDM